MLASYINPPFERVKTRTPSLYAASVEAPSPIRAALADAPNSKLPWVNLSVSLLFLKKII